jgi:hypothetical protein
MPILLIYKTNIAWSRSKLVFKIPYLTGETEESPRKEIFYFDDDGSLNTFRYN